MPWPTKKLVDVCDIVKSGVTPFDGEKEYIDTNSVQNFSIVKSQTVTYTKRPSRANMGPKANDVLVAKMADTVKVYLANPGDETKRIFSTGFFVLRPKNDLILPNFLFFYCASNLFQSLKDTLARGSTQKALNNEKLRKYFEIPLPPLEIQKQIVARIEELFEKIDGAKELRQKAREESAEIFQSAMAKIFEKIEEGYTSKMLKELLTQLQYGLSKKMNQNKKGYKIFRMDNIIDYKMNDKNIKYVEISGKEFLKYKLRKGDVLFNRVNSFELVGKTGIFDLSGDYTFASYLIRLQPNRKFLNPYFLNYFLNSPQTKSKLRFMARRAVQQANINAKEVSSLEIPLPPLSEQKKIVAYLDNLREKIEKLKELQQKQLEELEELKKSILNKAFKGEL